MVYLLLLGIVFGDRDGKVRAMILTEPTPDTVIRSLDNRRSVFTPADDLFRTKSTAKAARLTPITKNYLFVTFFRLFGLALPGGAVFIRGGRIVIFHFLRTLQVS